MFEALFSSSQARVLRFLARHADQTFIEREIVEATGVSRSAVNLATRALFQAGLLRREQRGRISFYSTNDHHPFVRQFKVLDTLAQLEPLLKELRPLARQIILFGSCAEGTNTSESDVDLFILTHERDQVMGSIRRYAFSRLQLIVADTQEWMVMKEKDKAFYEQLKRGIVLWEMSNELGT
mgnify:CR=1 FL=1